MADLLDNQGGAPPRNNHEATLGITQEERRRALAIKAKVEADEKLTNLDDFDYAQFALTSLPEESLEVVCERVRLQQEFKRAFNIQDDFWQGLDLFHHLLTQQPRLLLTATILPFTYNLGIFINLDAFSRTKIESQEAYTMFMGALYSLLQCQNRDIQSMRVGISLVVECRTCSFDAHNQALLEKMMADFCQHYPGKLQECYLLNTTADANVLYGLVKRSIPKHIQKKVLLGQQLRGMPPGVGIESLYDQAGLDLGQQQMLLNVALYSALRERNRSVFSLDSAEGPN